MFFRSTFADGRRARAAYDISWRHFSPPQRWRKNLPGWDVAEVALRQPPRDRRDWLRDRGDPLPARRAAGSRRRAIKSVRRRLDDIRRRSVRAAIIAQRSQQRLEALAHRAAAPPAVGCRVAHRLGRRTTLHLNRHVRGAEQAIRHRSTRAATPGARALTRPEGCSKLLLPNAWSAPHQPSEMGLR